MRLQRTRFGSLVVAAQRGAVLYNALLSEAFTPETKRALELLQDELNAALTRVPLRNNST